MRNEGKEFVEPAFGSQQHETADGKLYLIKDMSHQHLSNLFYYMQVNPGYNNRIAKAHLAKLNYYIKLKFKELLHYSPFFDWEVRYLIKEGLTNSQGEITINGERVGRISEYDSYITEKVYENQELERLLETVVDRAFVKITEIIVNSGVEVSTGTFMEIRKELRELAKESFKKSPGPAMA